jgi:hypothetical protein
MCSPPYPANACRYGLHRAVQLQLLGKPELTAFDFYAYDFTRLEEAVAAIR